MSLNFPFELTGTQNKMIQSLAKIFNEKKVGAIEASTGIGKTITVLYSALKLTSPLEKELFEDILNFPRLYKRKNMKEKGQTQILYASRTHSQLAQVKTELQKILRSNLNSFYPLKSENFSIFKESEGFNPGIPNSSKKRKDEQPLSLRKLLAVPFSSKKALCINMLVNTPNASSEAVNLSCKNMRTKNKCPYFDPGGFIQQLNDFESQPYSKVLDLEDLKQIGKEHCICPYYVSKYLSPKADLITTPYQFLIDKKTVEKKFGGMNEKVLIIDEAHNFPDSVEEKYSASLNDIDLQIFLELGKSILRGGNNNSLIIIEVVGKIFEFLNKKSLMEKKVFSVEEFVLETGLIDINFHRINFIFLKNEFKKFCASPNNPLAEDIKVKFLNKKIKKFSDLILYLRKVLRGLEVFFNGLGFDDPSSFIFFTKSPVTSSIVYYCSQCFSKLDFLFRKSSAVVFLSGTLNPHSFYKKVLMGKENAYLKSFSRGLDENKCKVYLCSNNIFESSRAEKAPIDLTQKNREASENITFLFHLLNSIERFFRKIKGGIVVFFQSYKYLNFFVNKIRGTGKFERLDSKTKVFIERESSWEDYSNYINKGNSGVLFAVMRGKLSEGVNFSGDLCRCLIVFGLPYPDISDLRLRFKSKFFGGDSFYTDLCVRTLNQTLGRGIRDALDYCTFFIIDKRIDQSKYKNFLPNYMKDFVVSVKNWTFKDLLENIKNFCALNCSGFCTKGS